MGATNIERLMRGVEAEPWAMDERALQAIAGLLAMRAATGGLPSTAQVQAANRAADTGYRKQGSIAVIPVIGTVSRRIGMVEAMSGGASVEGIGRAFDRAMQDNSVGAILLEMHSPGGSVHGVTELSNKIYSARGRKRVVAIADSAALAAAYVIGSAAGEFYCSPSGECGGIGVYMVHFDWSAHLKEEGVKPTIIKAGPHKAEGNPYEPLGKDAHAHLQQQIEDYHTLMVDAVARNRSVSAARVRREFGGGRTLTAQRAANAGLVDGVRTPDEVMQALASGRPAPARSAAVFAPAPAAAVTAGPILPAVLPDYAARLARSTPENRRAIRQVARHEAAHAIAFHIAGAGVQYARVIVEPTADGGLRLAPSGRNGECAPRDSSKVNDVALAAGLAFDKMSGDGAWSRSAGIDGSDAKRIEAFQRTGRAHPARPSVAHAVAAAEGFVSGRYDAITRLADAIEGRGLITGADIPAIAGAELERWSTNDGLVMP